MNKRRVGLGITGLGDTLWMLGMQYGDENSLSFCGSLARAMRDSAYRASVDLAREKGPFPVFDSEKFLGGAFVQGLPDDIRDGIATYGIRNSHLLTIAPTGTTSLLWGNISSGVEPIFALEQVRKIREGDGSERTIEVDNHAFKLWKGISGNGQTPDVLLSSQTPARGHIDVMAAFQKYFDASISKTIIFDPNTSFDDFRDTFLYAHEKGLKGCTVYRESGKVGSVIKARDNGYVDPMTVPDERIKYCENVVIPNEGAYEVEVTIVENKPREVWMHAPLENKFAALIEAIVRLTSVMLRCTIRPETIMKQLRKANMSYGSVSSPLAYIERALLKVMAKFGVRQTPGASGASCPVCGGVLIMAEGCIKCSSCTYDACA
jgi:hypothetical protein